MQRCRRIGVLGAKPLIARMTMSRLRRAKFARESTSQSESFSRGNGAIGRSGGKAVEYILKSFRGCVTPVVIHNWKEASGGDFDYVDGFDALPEDIQNKVRRAFEQGHVDDEDWNGVCL